MKRKLTALFLATVLAVGGTLLLASCQAEQQDTTAFVTTQHVCTIGPTEYLNIPIDFKKAPIEDRILSVVYFDPDESIGTYTRRSLKSDELDEGNVDVAAKARDALLLEKYGLELDIKVYAPPNGYYGGFPGAHYELYDSILTSICSGKSEFDIIVSKPGIATLMTQSGYLLNFDDDELFIPDQLDVIDLDSSHSDYWNKAYNDALSYKGNHYWITGDLALRNAGSMYATYVNESLYNEIAGRYGYDESIFETVKEGKWTIDCMAEMITTLQSIAPDANGFVYESNSMLTAMAMGMGFEFSSTDPKTGNVAITLNNQHTFNIGNKLNELTEMDSSKKYVTPSNALRTIASMEEFAKGNSLFAVNTLIAGDSLLKDMKKSYFMVPLPKYDVKDEYRTPLAETVDIFAIPVTSAKIPQALVALEFLSAYSRNHVTPLFFDDVLHGQYTRDPDKSAMIDLIHENAYGDFVHVWNSNVSYIEQFFYDNTSDITLSRRIILWTEALAEFTGKLDDAVETYQTQKEKILST